MAMHSHRVSRAENDHDNTVPERRWVPLVPALIGMLAVANVASVVLALME